MALWFAARGKGNIINTLYISFMLTTFTGEINLDDSVKVCLLDYFPDQDCCWLHNRMMAHAHYIDSQCVFCSRTTVMRVS